MKAREYLNLQLFADDPETPPVETPPATTAPPAAPPATPPVPPPVPKYTDEDVNGIISKKFADWESKQQKKINEATKLAEMNAQQKAEYERDALQKALDEYQKKDNLSDLMGTARKMLAEKSITVPDELLSTLVSDNAEQTKSAVDGFVKTFSESVENAVKERLKGKTPVKGVNQQTMTKEQIMAIADSELRQQKMIEHRELFDF